MKRLAEKPFILKKGERPLPGYEKQKSGCLDI